MVLCKTMTHPRAEDIGPGVVLHDERCEREWLVLSHDTAKMWDREGIYPALYFDKKSRGIGVNAVLLGQEVIELHISTRGLLAEKPA